MMAMRTKSAEKEVRKAGAPAKTKRQPRKNAKEKDAGASSAGPAGRLKPLDLTPSEKIDRHIAGIADWRGSVLATIRRIMLAANPAVTEDWKWMGSPVWYCDGIIAVANPHRGKVKLTFAKGAHFADTERLFNAGLDGKEWRAIDLFENDRLDEAALLRLVKTAITYNRAQRKAKEGNKVVPTINN
jgi:hypothetical protein